MAIITGGPDYVSYDTAKQLKEVGYPQNGHCHCFETRHRTWFYNNDPHMKYTYDCPTLDEAARWLINKKALHIMVDCIGKKNWVSTVQNMDSFEDWKIEGDVSKVGGRGHDSYEIVMEKAILKSIELLKKKS